MKEIITDKKSFEKDSSSQIIYKYLNKKITNEDSRFYYRKLLYDNGSKFCPDITIVDKEYGVLLFKTYNYDENKINKISEDSWTIEDKEVKSTLLNFRDYVHMFNSDINRPSHDLQNKINIHSYVCFPFLDQKSQSMASTFAFGNYLYKNFDKIEIFEKLEKKPIDEKDWIKLLNIVMGIQSLSKYVGLHIDHPPKNLREASIVREQRIAVYDDNQDNAATQMPDSGFSIRGIAGTGKTIILAWKAAYLHRLYPDKKIVYTFYTKSLYNQIRKFITNFYNKYFDGYEEPNWENLQILHAWGGSYRRGIYYNACINNGVKPLTVYNLKLFHDPFEAACADLLEKKRVFNEVYDYVLIDEAQDMPSNFFKIAYKLTKSPKIIGIAYDELQNTENVKMPEFEKLFGNDKNGKPLLTLKPENDHILRISYRNDGKILNLALALGLGLYDYQSGINQIIDKDETWYAIGYKIVDGKLEFNKKLRIERPKENSPIDIEKIYTKIPSVNLECFNTKQEELDFVSDKIVTLIKDEEINPEDIIVMSLNRRLKEDFLYIHQKLISSKINSKIPGILDAGDDFFIEGNVTLSSLRRSKGNEAPIVFLMGIDKIFQLNDKVKAREKRSFAFVSLTRAKGWCFISGSGSNMKFVKEEVDLIMKDYPFFNFTFPNKEEYEQIKQISYYTENEKSKEKYFEGVDAIRKYVKKGQYLPDDVKEILKKYVEDEVD